MAESKADKVADLIRRLIEAEVAEMLLYRSSKASALPSIDVVTHEERRQLSIGVGGRIRNPYVWRELTDIMAWKKPKGAE